MKNFTLLIILCLLSVITFGQEAAFNWETTELNPSHNLKTMSVFGEEAIIAGYGNTFFKSTDNGDSWNSINLFNAEYNFPDISIKGSVGYVVGSRYKLYDAAQDVYTNGLILRTTDGGLTWANMNLNNLGLDADPSLNPADTLCFGLDFQAIETINDSVAYCALRWYEYSAAGKEDHSGIFKTADSAKTWLNISGDLEGNVITSIVSYGDNIYIGGNKLLFKTTVNTDEITDILDSIHGDGTEYVTDFTFIDDQEFYVVTNLDSISHTLDGGVTFNKLGGIKGGWDLYKVNDSTIVVGGSTNKSYASTDNGVNWNSLGISASIWEVPGIVNDSLYMLADATIYKIDLSDLTSGNYIFSTQEVGNGNLQKAHISDDDHVIVTGNNLSLLSTNNAGLTWNNIEIPEIAELEELLEDIDFDCSDNQGDTAYICFNRIKFVDYTNTDDIYWSGGNFYTDDKWETFKSIDVAKIGAADEDDPAKNPNHENCNGVNTSYIKYLENNILLAWVGWFDYSGVDRIEHSMVFKTIDGGKNWTTFTDDLGSNILQDIEVKGNLVYIAGRKLLLKSENAGETFTNIYPNLDMDEDDDMFVNSIWIGDENEIFLTTSVDGVFMSADGGNSFTPLSTVGGSSDFFQFDASSFIFLGSNSSKSLFTNDSGTTWQDCHPGAAIYEIGGVFNNKLYALGRGSFFTVDLDDLELTTSIIELDDNNSIKIQYHTDHINVVSTNNIIDQCFVYSVTGQLMTIKEPNSNICRLNNYAYKPGIYVIVVSVNGEKSTEKIVFK